MKTSIPYFLIIGAPKCGTTALWYLLDQHEDIYMSVNKEPRFFTRVKGSMETKITGDGPRLSGTYDNGEQWYNELFKGALPTQKTGEASTVYFANEDAAQLIYDFNPGVKLILCLRNPVKRLYSHYWQEHKLGFNFPSFEQMLKEDHPRLRYYKKISHYKTHLERYFSVFPKDQLHIIIHEEFNQKPDEHMKELWNFLELPPKSIDTSKRYNEQKTFKSKNFARVLTVLKTSGPALRKIMPDAIFNKVNIMRRRAIKLNSQPLKYPPLSENLYEELSKEYVKDIEYIEENVFKRKIDLWHNQKKLNN